MRLRTEPDHAAYPYGNEGGDASGMTKREYFAALAMQALISSSELPEEQAGTLGVRFADALIAALNERRET